MTYVDLCKKKQITWLMQKKARKYWTLPPVLFVNHCTCAKRRKLYRWLKARRMKQEGSYTEWGACRQVSYSTAAPFCNTKLRSANSRIWLKWKDMLFLDKRDYWIVRLMPSTIPARQNWPLTGVHPPGHRVLWTDLRKNNYKYYTKIMCKTKAKRIHIYLTESLNV